jgi:hypothetical protein
MGARRDGTRPGSDRLLREAAMSAAGIPLATGEAGSV